MKFLFDQNISPKILKFLPEEYFQSQQDRFVGLEDTADFEIFLYARKHGFAIVTFDSDFMDLNAMHGTPPKIIYLNTGNLSTRNIIELFINNILRINHYLRSDSDDILELLKSK